MSLAALTVKIGADLTDLNRGLADAGKGVGDLGKQMTGNLTAPIRGVTTAATANAKAVTSAGASWKSLREPLTSATRSLLQLSPAVAQVTSVMGSMAIGAGPMIAILAGVAALGAGWNKLTEGAKETKKATEDAIKSLAALRDEQRLGSLAGTKAREAEKAGTELFFVQEDLAKWKGREGKKIWDQDNVKSKISELEAEEKRLRDLIAGFGVQVAAIRQKNTEERIRLSKKAADAEISDFERIEKAWQALSQSFRRTEGASEQIMNLPALDFRNMTGRMQSRLTMPGDPLSVASVSGLTPPKVPEQVVPALSKVEDAMRTGFAEVSVAIGQTLAANLAGIFGGGRGAQIGGSILGAAGGAAAGQLLGSGAGAIMGSVVPVIGTIAGSFLGSAIGSLFDHKRSVDQNTAAVMRLTEAMYNEPAGFKLRRYQYQADAGSSAMDELMRKLNYGADQFGSRGGYAFAGGI